MAISSSTSSSFIRMILIILMMVVMIPAALKVSAEGDSSNNHNQQQLRWKRVIRVSESSSRYKTIQSAIDAVPSNNADPVLIRLEAGVYKEKVVIPENKPYIILTGKNNANQTVITWDDSGDIRNSPTFTVHAPNFIARYLTFQNTHGPGAKAVALRVTGDMATFYSCRILSYQDTLLAEQGRQYYSNCYIQGEVDFIFGSAAAIFEQCHIRSLSKGDAAITAQMRSSEEDKGGFYFVKCKVTGVKSCVLGRPWGKYSRVVFAYTYMSSAVLPQGWNDWGKTDAHETVYYGEYQCYGPGSNRSHRVNWSRTLTAQQASPFTTTNVIQGNGWIKI